MSIIKSMRQRLGLERKAAPVARFGTAWLSTGDPVWTGHGYRALVQSGYQRNVIVHRAVRLVAECAASVPLQVYEKGKRRDEHPVLSLLRSPNPMCVCASFLEEIYSHLLLAGNAYIEQVTSPSGEVAELYTLRPDRMRVEPGARGWPAAYIYEVGGEKRRYPVHAASGRSAILHVKSFHPLDDHYGLPALEAAAMGIDIHNAASSWNKALLDNAARPSGALVFEPGDGAPGNLTDEQVTRLKEEMAAQFQGAVNAGRPLLLEGGLKWQQMAFSPSDMDFINTKHVAAREIALAFGVPPMLLGIPGDNTYANYQEANRAFWRLTLLPLVDRVLGSLGRWLDDEDGDLRLEADRDRITALAVERDALWTRLGSAAFMTTNEKRAEVGLDPVEGGDDLPSLQEVGNAFGPFELREKKRSAQLVERPDLEPVMVKIWRTQSDGTVRESHRAADGQIVLEDELFKVGDAELREPRDPDGPIEEVINCRCQVDYKLITELQGEERQRAQGVIRDRCQQLNVDLAILQLNIDDALRKIENTQDELKKKMESANFSAKKSIIDIMKVAAELMASLSTPKNVTILALRSSALGRLISLVEFMYSFDENVKEFIENDNEAKDAVKDINFHLDFIEKTQEKVRAKLELMERLDCATSVNR